MLIFCDFIQVYLLTTNHHLKLYKIHVLKKLCKLLMLHTNFSFNKFDYTDTCTNEQVNTVVVSYV